MYILRMNGFGFGHSCACADSPGKACPDREPLEIIHRVFFRNNQKEELKTQKEDVFFHIVSSGLVFSLDLVTGATIVMSQGCPSISTPPAPAEKDHVKGEQLIKRSLGFL